MGSRVPEYRHRREHAADVQAALGRRSEPVRSGGPRMEARRRTWFDDRGLVLGTGRSLPFYAGAMHYWRVPPAQWAPCLRAMHSLGLTLVETYVPWRVHEPEHGERAWTD